MTKHDILKRVDKLIEHDLSYEDLVNRLCLLGDDIRASLTNDLTTESLIPLTFWDRIFQTGEDKWKKN